MRDVNQRYLLRETDPAQNAAADAVVAILMGDAPEAAADVDSEWGVPSTLIAKAGRALANRYCFAVEKDEDGKINVLVTPIAHFEAEGACSDQSGPIDHLLPPSHGSVSESTWEFYVRSLDTPLKVAVELQRYGFVWNRDFQDFIDASLTQELSYLETDPDDLPAVEQVMDMLERDDDLPWNHAVCPVLHQVAIEDGLASRFRFFVTQNDTGMGDEPVFAVIYPAGKDDTWKGDKYLIPLLPEGNPVDECVQTEWHFSDMGYDTPAKIAKLLHGKGFSLDIKAQLRAAPTFINDIQTALGTSYAPAAAAKPPRP